ncbi:MAG TPA: response regulator, partial [Burkholderiaceae bacterium]|nr:response regulator [Burkholderiaceae bacterium]
MPLRILLIDDNPDDRTLVVREINKVLTNAIVDEIGDALDFEATMTSGREWDVAVTDYQLGWSTGLHVFHRLRSQWPELPVIMFTASGNEDIAVAALKDGLDDYITKTAVHYGRIPYAVRACGERRRRRREAQDATSALRRNEAILQLALDAAHMEVWEHDLDTRKTLLHGRAEHVFGGQRRELSREQLFELLHPD